MRSNTFREIVSEIGRMASSAFAGNNYETTTTIATTTAAGDDDAVTRPQLDPIIVSLIVVSLLMAFVAGWKGGWMLNGNGRSAC